MVREDTAVEGVTIWDSALLHGSKSKIFLGWGPWDSSPGIGLFLRFVSPKDSGVVFVLLLLKSITKSVDGGTISVMISWVSVLVQSKDWSRVWSKSFSPGIGSFLSIDRGLSGGLGIGVGLMDMVGKDTIVIGVTIWNGTSLVQGKNWSGIWSPSVSPGIRSFLSVDGSLSGGFGISVGLVDMIGKNSIVISVTIWVGVALNESIWVDWSTVWGPSLSPLIGSFLSIDGGLSGGLGIGMSLVDMVREDTIVESISIWDGSGLHGS
jgi:hypothetical protein